MRDNSNGGVLAYKHHWAGIVLATLLTTPAVAGETPLYQPTPGWVVPVSLPDLTKIKGELPAIILFDVQQRIEDGGSASYVDAATRMVSPEMLAQFATLAVPWMPDKGDLIVHELAIVRGGQTIDLLAQGQKFTVLRREQALEQRELTGILTATLAIEGLQVGDILHFRATTTSKDAALAGKVQSIGQIVAAPARVGYAHMRFLWPTAAAPKWKVLAEGVIAKPVVKGAYTELSVALPAPKQPEVPDNAPVRYRHPPLMELSTFADWADVSRIMAPLYATDGLIVPGSPIEAEIAAITKAEITPLGRAERALELVQDKIRYLAVGMDGGNYVPQKPEKTWAVRYGDCKAKTLLLLAILRAMKIEAEPVLAHSNLGDFVPDRLPSAGAFNHVLVRATIDGQILWLDGTGSGSRIADIHDTPPFGHVLPVRPAGAQLMTIKTHANARPFIDLALDVDESASSDLPSVFDATAIIRGPLAARLALVHGQLSDKDQRATVGQFYQRSLGEIQLSSSAIIPDPVAGTVTLKAQGVRTTLWYTDERKRKRTLTRSLDGFEFAPDRGRPAWTTIPVAVPDPYAVRYRLRLRLPDGGKGYTLEGEPDLKTSLAGFDLIRATRLENGVVSVDERIDATGGEIPVAQIPIERDKVAAAKARAPRIIAGEDSRRRWDIAGVDPAGATQVKAINATYVKAITDDPDQTSSYISRASFRSGIGDRRGAYDDLTHAIKIEPTAELYLRRAAAAYEMGNLAGSLADAEEARKLDPSSEEAIGRVGYIKAERGDLAGAVALLDERIAIGGDNRVTYTKAKASILGEFGDPGAAIKIYDMLVAEKPGSPELLNALCWTKATRSVMLDTALKDCTSAIELSSDTNGPLDSRALVWYKLGRFDDALRDLDVVLASTPGLAQSRFLRGVVLTRLRREAEAAKDLTIARRITPSVDRTYARYGIKP